MATTYTTRTALPKPADGDIGWGTTWRAQMDALDAAQAVGALAVSPAERPSASLNVQVAAGVFISSAGAYVTYAGTASFGLTASGTRYLWLTDGGTLTAGSAFPSSGTKCVRLAVVVAGATTLTSVTDARVPFVSAG
jgi:hypothetical protein